MKSGHYLNVQIVAFDSQLLTCGRDRSSNIKLAGTEETLVLLFFHYQYLTF